MTAARRKALLTLLLAATLAWPSLSRGEPFAPGCSLPFAPIAKTHPVDGSCPAAGKGVAEPGEKQLLRFRNPRDAYIPELQVLADRREERRHHLVRVPDMCAFGPVQAPLMEVKAHPVRVTGHLFFDASHKPCESDTDPTNPKRISLWEIHPVYAIDVCVNGTLASCPAANDSKWIPLDKWVNTEEDDDE